MSGEEGRSQQSLILGSDPLDKGERAREVTLVIGNRQPAKLENSSHFFLNFGFGEVYWAFGQLANLMWPIHTPKLAVYESFM